jgi:hypothetical protein
VRSQGHGTVDDHGLDLGHAAGVRRSLDHLGSILRPGERIICGAQGFLEGRPGLVLATNSRFMFVYRDETPIDSAYEDIVRFRAKVGILASDLEIEDANGVASIRQIHPRARLADLAGILQKGPGPDPGAAPLPGAGAPAPAKKAAGSPALSGGKSRARAKPPRGQRRSGTLGAAPSRPSRRSRRTGSRSCGPRSRLSPLATTRRSPSLLPRRRCRAFPPPGRHRRASAGWPHRLPPRRRSPRPHLGLSPVPPLLRRPRLAARQAPGGSPSSE